MHWNYPLAVFSPLSARASKPSRAGRAIFALCLPLVLLAGCGVTPGPGADQSHDPPSQPPPVATQSGTVTISPQYAAVLPGLSLIHI